MGKNPAFQFYPGDWSRDLEEHPLEIEGAWIRICCKLWWSDTRGSLTRTMEQWAKILRVDNSVAERIICYIKTWKIGDVSYDPNGFITIISRRMNRDEKDRENNRERQRRFYEKKKPNADLTPTSQRSSSSSSTSKIKKEKKRVFVKPSFDEVSDYCRERKNGINPKAWIDHYESNGWMVGKNKMKDWKAAVRTWEARNKEEQYGNNGRGRQYGFNRTPGPEIDQGILEQSERLRRKYESP